LLENSAPFLPCFVSIMVSQVTNSLGVLGILLLESYVTDDIIGVCAQCRTGRE
jgi:hypothetical protein